MKYYSIRVVEAGAKLEAESKVEESQFEESDGLCDCVMTHDELVRELLERALNGER